VNNTVAPVESIKSVPETNIFKDDYVYMMFTSGSTGKPKGVPISHKNVLHYLKIMTQYGLYNFTPEDRFLQAIELTFDMSILGIFVAWEVGGCVYPVKLDGLAYLNVLKTLQEHKITVSYVVPSVVTYAKKYLEAGEINLSHLRYSFFAGEALLVSHVKAWSVAAKNTIIENVFGPTEATNTFLRYRWEKESSEKESVNGAVSIGRPNPGIATTIISESDSIVSDGERGQLCVYGDQVADGYWKDKEKTDRSFVYLPESGLPGRWYKTGDLAYLNENGNYIYCGRCDNQIKINGFRVELDEIEFHIRNIVNLEMVAVLYRSVAPEGIYGFIEAENPDWNSEKVLSQLTEFVPEYMIPKSITILKKMPLNINGKIDRNALKELIQEKKK
jgi:amino acid adenylation domain-containing protein